MANQDMLINFVRGEECRIAIVEDGKLEELYTERTSAELHVGNIYRGRVTNVEPAIQAAFVDFGMERAGFLHITDLHPRYFPGEDQETTERVGQKTPRRERPPIQKCLRRGQEILVQVLKEGIGTKGPTLTSYLSIPGRYLVMMPHMERHGVSRKIEDPEKRKEIHRILDDINPPEGFGFIVRTAGFGRPKTELKRDLSYLLRLWKDIESKSKGRGPAELFRESDLIVRTLRDVMTADVKRIIVDERHASLSAKQFLRISMPRTSIKVFNYSGTLPIFDAFDIERQIQSIHERRVPLPSGGSLIFDQTEAMVAIDVNSGKSRDQSDAETTAFKTNMEAVEEIARQLRLRDLGGIIVLDLIDMYQARHRRDVEKKFKDLMKTDRARTKLVKISELGLLEMTRQRMRPSLKKSVYDPCPMCNGMSHVLSRESVALEVMRRLAVALHHDKVYRVELTAHPDVLAMLLNRRRAALVRLEQSSGKSILFKSDASLGPDRLLLDAFDIGGAKLDMEKMASTRPPALTDRDEITVEQLAMEGAFEEEAEEETTEPAAEPQATAPTPASTPAAKAAARQQVDEVPDEESHDEEPSRTAPTPGGTPSTGQDSAADGGEGEGGGKRRKRRRRRRRRRGGGGGEQGQQSQAGGEAPSSDEPGEGDEAESASEGDHDEPAEQPTQPQPRQPRPQSQPPRQQQPAQAPRQPQPPRPRPPVEPAGYEAADAAFKESIVDDDEGPQPGNTLAPVEAQDAEGGESGGQEGGARRRRRRGGRRRRRGGGGGGGNGHGGNGGGQ